MASLIIPTTISSVTSAPDSIAALTFLSMSVPAAKAARKMSSVDKWQGKYSSLSNGDRVPCIYKFLKKGCEFKEKGCEFSNLLKL